MKRKIRYFHCLFVSILILLSSCNNSNRFDGRNGIKTSHHANGKIRTEIEFKDGLMNGRCISYDLEGKIKSELYYKEGFKSGPSKSYYSNSNIKSLTFYKKGKRDSVFYEYFEDGKVKKEGKYKDGKLEGEMKAYYENGKVLSLLNYKNNKKHGEQRYFYDSGQLKAVTDFYDGRPGIKLEEYTSDGKKIKHDLRILTKEVNKLAFEEMYFYLFKLNKSSSDDQFYMGELDQGKYLPVSYYTLKKKDGFFVKDFFVPQYAYLMDKLNFIAVTKTKFGHDLILTKTVNVAINNYN